MKSILTLEDALGNWLVRDYRRRTFKRARARAYASFVQTYPQAQEQLFDEHFLTHRAAPLLESSLLCQTPDPVALAHAWADEWAFSEEARARHVADMVPLAEDFLGMLEAELHQVWSAGRTDTPASVRVLRST